MSVVLILIAALGFFFGAVAFCLLVYNIAAYFTSKKEILRNKNKVKVKKFKKITPSFIEKPPSVFEKIFYIGEDLAFKRYFLEKTGED